MMPLFHLLVVVLTFSLMVPRMMAEERVLILGDSITYGGGWATRVEARLRSAPTFAEAAIVNLGLPSETVSGLSEPNHADGKFPRPDLHERLARVLTAFKPTLVLSCYGMNDGIYLPLDATRQAAFAQGYGKLHQAVLALGARHIAITPPLFDADHPPGKARYDEVLDAQAAWLTEQRTAGWEVIDPRPALRAAVAATKQADSTFVYAKDTVHPGEIGHRLFAEALLPDLGRVLALPEPVMPISPAALAILRKRHDLLKDAWLTATGHRRPGMTVGVPLPKAEADAAALLTQYRAKL